MEMESIRVEDERRIMGGYGHVDADGWLNDALEVFWLGPVCIWEPS